MVSGKRGGLLLMALMVKLGVERTGLDDHIQALISTSIATTTHSIGVCVGLIVSFMFLAIRKGKHTFRYFD